MKSCHCGGICASCQKRRGVTKIPAQTAHREIFVPHHEITKPKKSYTYEPLKGHEFVLAVHDKGKCIGFILTSRLGYQDAIHWMRVNWHEKG